MDMRKKIERERELIQNFFESTIKNLKNVGLPVSYTDHFKREGVWIKVTDWGSFVAKIIETKKRLGIVWVHAVREHNALWVHCNNDYYYYFQLTSTKKIPLRYII